jgi:hypothetical protein
MRILIFVLIAACLAGAFLGGCRKKEADKSQQKSQPQISKEATKQKQPFIMNISDNPGYYSSSDVTPSSSTRDLDNLLRPELKNLFGDAKLVAENFKMPQCRDCTETMRYVVKQILSSSDGDALHSALKAEGFVPSEVIGLKPYHSKTYVAMSFERTTTLRPYILCIQVNLDDQTIVVQSYRLDVKQRH